MKYAKLTRQRLPVPATLLLLIALTTVAATSAAEARQLKDDSRIAALITELERVRTFRQVALSPDASQIAWVVDSPGGHARIELAPISKPAMARQVSAVALPGACDEEEIAWSPDGEQLAFVSDCDSAGQAEVYLANRKTLSPRKLSNLHGFLQSVQWSPDGKSLAFLYTEGATRRAGALDAMKPPAGVIGEDGLEIQRVAILDVASGKLRVASPPNLHIYEFDWSPDSTRFVYIAAAPPGENNWWVAQLYTQDAVGGGEAHSIFDPGTTHSALHGLQVAVPRWSPDGKDIAFIGGLMSDQGATGGDIYTMSAAGGEPRLISPDVDPNVSIAWIRWSEPNSIQFTYISGGLSGYGNVQPSNSAADAEVNFLVPATVGDGRLEMSLSFAKDGTVAFIRSSFTQPPEVWAGHFGGADGVDDRRHKKVLSRESAARPQVIRTGEPDNGPRRITRVNDAFRPAWGKAESVTWSSDAPTGKFNVQGWLLYPANYDPQKKYPMIVSVHGGPASAMLPAWPGAGFNATVFSSLGYFVLFPNPRGSYGQGETFTAANRKDFGYGDLQDILHGVDSVVAKYPVDANRIGLTGWSYGGFMTMFAVTQTTHFRAAVAGAGISNWQSYYGQNSIDQWMTPYFGASVYDDPAAYYKSSAINFIRQAKTPTLLVVGDRDGECPAPQSFEFWHALSAQHTPARLVVYPNEGHRFVSPEHRRDVLQRAAEWFAQYMPAEP